MNKLNIIPFKAETEAIKYPQNGSGIFIHNEATAYIEDCDIFGNANAGVEIKTGGNPTLRRCTIKNNVYEAVWVYDKGRCTIEDCDLRENKLGSWNIDSTSQVGTGILTPCPSP